MIINATLINSLNACKGRYDNYVNNYGTSDFTVDSFLDLDKITYSDKIWVLSRLMNASQSRTFALLCAESVLPIYQARYPNDNRVSDCINFLKSVKDLGNLTEIEKEQIKAHRNDADNAATDAANAADAAYAAISAANAADAAYAAISAANATDATDAAYAAISAAISADNAAANAL